MSSFAANTSHIKFTTFRDMDPHLHFEHFFMVLYTINSSSPPGAIDSDQKLPSLAEDIENPDPIPEVTDNTINVLVLNRRDADETCFFSRVYNEPTPISKIRMDMILHVREASGGLVNIGYRSTTECSLDEANVVHYLPNEDGVCEMGVGFYNITYNEALKGVFETKMIKKFRNNYKLNLQHKNKEGLKTLNLLWIESFDLTDLLDLSLFPGEHETPVMIPSDQVTLYALKEGEKAYISNGIFEREGMCPCVNTYKPLKYNEAELLSYAFQYFEVIMGDPHELPEDQRIKCLDEED